MAEATEEMWDGFPEAPFDEIVAGRSTMREKIIAARSGNFGVAIVGTLMFGVFWNDLNALRPITVTATFALPYVVIFSVGFLLGLPIGAIERLRDTRRLADNETNRRARLTKTWREARYPFLVKQHESSRDRRTVWRERLGAVPVILVVLLAVGVLTALMKWVIPDDVFWSPLISGLFWGWIVGWPLCSLLTARALGAFVVPSANDEFIAERLGREAHEVEMKAYYDWQRQYGNANG